MSLTSTAVRSPSATDSISAVTSSASVTGSAHPQVVFDRGLPQTDPIRGSAGRSGPKFGRQNAPVINPRRGLSVKVYFGKSIGVARPTPSCRTVRGFGRAYLAGLAPVAAAPPPL